VARTGRPPQTSPPADPRVCSKCHESKPLNNFDYEGVTQLGLPRYRGYCKDCRAAVRREYRQRNVDAFRQVDRGRWARRRATWSPERIEEVRRKNREWSRGRGLAVKREGSWHNQGIRLNGARLTFDAFLSISIAQSQDHRCAVCREPVGVDRLHVDHDHATGEFRGLLCHLCNRGLGHFGDSPERLDAAAVYLRAVQERNSRKTA
jgi:hypothetical protein